VTKEMAVHRMKAKDYKSQYAVAGKTAVPVKEAGNFAAKIKHKE
jgi:hypothetical protein